MFPFLGRESETNRLNKIINDGANTVINKKRFIELAIAKWKKSPERKMMLTGEAYYKGEHDILSRKRTVIGEKGQIKEVENLPNNKIVDNQYSKLVDQKVNYLLGKPLTFETENKDYIKALKSIFNNRFLRTLSNVGESSLNGGIAWLHPYYNDNGDLCFKRFEPYEVLPFWKDSDHTELDFAVRLYSIEAYEGEKEVTIEKVDIYHKDGIEHYLLKGSTLTVDVEKPSSTHMIVIDGEKKEVGHNWEKTPLIGFKYNNKETPLIKRVKSLQDGINTILSDFQNNMQEDARNTILVLHNYEGTDLGEFRRNLAQYGAVKVKTTDGVAGDLKTLEVTVNAENYKSILNEFNKKLIENGRGFDAKNDKMSGNPNQMNIQSMYSDIDLDANGMEIEFQASFEDLLWFVNQHLANTGAGDFEDEEVKVIFNRDILINESESIENCRKSVGILPMESIISQHPWTSDVELELQRLEEEVQKKMDDYNNAFPKIGGRVNGEEEE